MSLSKKRTLLGAIAEWGITEEDVESDVNRAWKTAKFFHDQSINDAMRRLKAARNLYIAFVVDTTGSMGKYIAGVKEQVNTIVQMLSRRQLNVHTAFVGYKDHCDGVDHFELLPFTTNIASFRTFVGRIDAEGGGDAAEDVLGGLNHAVRALNWHPDATNVLFHIADAPPHGRQFQSVEVTDDYPRGHPRDPALGDVFSKMKRRDIRYFFGKINSYTDRMLEIFAKHVDSVLCFDIQDPIDITSSVTTASTVSLDTKCKESMAVMSGRSATKSFVYSSLEPSWGSLPKTSGLLISYVAPKSVQELVKGSFERSSRNATFKIAQHPFAHGGERAAFYALEFHRGGSATQEMVLKTFLRGKSSAVNRFMNSMETQTVASFFAEKFNALIREKTGSRSHELIFLKAKVLRVGRYEPFQYYSVEKRYRQYDRKRFVKLSTNAGYVCSSPAEKEYVDYAVAFSHWTWHITSGYLMVVDLQGQLHDDNKMVLTDPAIHCKESMRYCSGTNLGSKGFVEFFRTHKCNRFCEALKLGRVVLSA